jgi:hypothetical protein
LSRGHLPNLFGNFWQSNRELLAITVRLDDGGSNIALIIEAFDAALEDLGDLDEPELAREVIAGRIIAAAKFW